MPSLLSTTLLGTALTMSNPLKPFYCLTSTQPHLRQRGSDIIATPLASFTGIHNLWQLWWGLLYFICSCLWLCNCLCFLGFRWLDDNPTSSTAGPDNLCQLLVLVQSKCRPAARWGGCPRWSFHFCEDNYNICTWHVTRNSSSALSLWLALSLSHQKVSSYQLQTKNAW